jgi:hypothetical protein
MPPQPEWVPRRARGKSRPDPTAAAVRVERRRSLILTAALATVLLGLFGHTLDGSLRTSRATDAHLRSLALDALFSEARNGIALEEVHLRYYQVEPSLPVRLRFVQTAGAVTTALERAARDRTPGSVEGHAAASRLLAEQRAYRELADRLIDLLDGANPDAARLDRQELAPAYTTLQADVEQVSQSFHIAAAREATEMSRAQSRMFLGTTIGFLLGLTLVAMIWRLVLGYQRRLVAHAAARRSTTRSAIRPATSCSRRPASGCATRYAPMPSSPGSAATSSPYCCRTSRTARRSSSSPTGSTTYCAATSG